MRKGPRIQVMKKDNESSFGLVKMDGNLPKSTFTRGGNIITINSIANGILVVL